MSDPRAGNLTMRKPWEWRVAVGGWRLDSDRPGRVFHAYDANNNAACEPHMGLFESAEEPNEGSRFCPACVEITKALPAGREKREYPSE